MPELGVRVKRPWDRFIQMLEQLRAEDPRPRRSVMVRTTRRGAALISQLLDEKGALTV